MAEQRPATLVDSNVLLDLFTQDPTWSAWSRVRLAEALDQGPVVVNQVVYSEVAYRFSTIEALDAVLTSDRFVRGNLPDLLVGPVDLLGKAPASGQSFLGAQHFGNRLLGGFAERLADQ